MSLVGYKHGSRALSKLPRTLRKCPSGESYLRLRMLIYLEGDIGKLYIDAEIIVELKLSGVEGGDTDHVVH